MDIISVVVVFTGLLFIIISKVINRENAKMLLAGYNTMSKSEREKFDIDGYLNFFKPFFFKLGAYTTLIYFITLFIFNVGIAVIAYTISILIPLPYIVIKGNKFYKKGWNISLISNNIKKNIFSKSIIKNPTISNGVYKQ